MVIVRRAKLASRLPHPCAVKGMRTGRLIGDEPNLPYQRPPLSKGFMTGQQNGKDTTLRPIDFYQSHRIDLETGTKVTEIDRLDRSTSSVADTTQR